MSAKRLGMFFWSAALGLACSPALAQTPPPGAPPTDIPALSTPPLQDSTPVASEPPPEVVATMGEDGVPIALDGEALGADAAPEAPPSDATQTEQVEDSDPSALTDFRETLDPYGRWVEHPSYGTIWVPYERSVGSKFAPYVSSGHWALNAQDEWVWVSNYPFGWVVFHYGRWIWAPNYGWSWIPGRRYAPAWVTFRTFPSGGMYIGWAPMQPMFIWRGGRPVWVSSFGWSPYVFCPMQYAFYPSVRSYVIYQNYRVRELVARSRRYAPAGTRTAQYASPPPRSLGAARSVVPRRRIQEDSRALAYRKYVGSSGEVSTTAGRLRALGAQPNTYRGASRARSSRPTRPSTSIRTSVPAAETRSQAGRVGAYTVRPRYPASVPAGTRAPVRTSSRGVPATLPRSVPPSNRSGMSRTYSPRPAAPVPNVRSSPAPRTKASSHKSSGPEAQPVPRSLPRRSGVPGSPPRVYAPQRSPRTARPPSGHSNRSGRVRPSGSSRAPRRAR